MKTYRVNRCLMLDIAQGQTLIESVGVTVMAAIIVACALSLLAGYEGNARTLTGECVFWLIGTWSVVSVALAVGSWFQHARCRREYREYLKEEAKK